ncbi:PiggyBac transposable element-derived protein 3 [Plakobranchus ocellatus]|uniref:PiggyBac transposable element-derived protein 3 n=1 Tax=Plakobranchus ocellatus TaxID=259542 RepID=A0AAV4AAK3_9GAST|nr:PiggyBac transposable element-derived protein 3 [Plakobranchus ocellatus]
METVNMSTQFDKQTVIRLRNDRANQDIHTGVSKLLKSYVQEQNLEAAGFQENTRKNTKTVEYLSALCGTKSQRVDQWNIERSCLVLTGLVLRILAMTKPRLWYPVTVMLVLSVARQTLAGDAYLSQGDVAAPGRVTVVDVQGDQVKDLCDAQCAAMCITLGDDVCESICGKSGQRRSRTTQCSWLLKCQHSGCTGSCSTMPQADLLGPVPVTPQVSVARSPWTGYINLSWPMYELAGDEKTVYLVSQKTGYCSWAQLGWVLGNRYILTNITDMCTLPTFKVAAVSRFGSRWFSEEVTTPEMDPHAAGPNGTTCSSSTRTSNTGRRLARFYAVEAEEAQIMFDDLPSDLSEEEDDSDAEDPTNEPEPTITSSWFSPPQKKMGQDDDGHARDFVAPRKWKKVEKDDCSGEFNHTQGILPSYTHYWSSEPDPGVEIVASTMTKSRFQALLLSNLHDNNEANATENDKLWRLRPLIDRLNLNFGKLYNANQCQSIDESMILFKGRSILKQCCPMKPIKRGYKLWIRADTSGYISKFCVYQGKGTKS